MTNNRTKEYWDKNIKNWGKLYLDISHFNEELVGPKWLNLLYHLFITPLEARLMAERYALTIDFIDQHVHPGTVAADIGCGTGVFTVEMLRRGARVKAIDISERSLSITKSLVEQLVPDHAQSVEFFQLDASLQKLPESDVALAMGVTPYAENLEPFYDNILPTTRVFYCLTLDPRHWANIIRKLLPMLNVRNMRCFDRQTVDALLEKHDWRLIERRNFASGYLDLAVRSTQRPTSNTFSSQQNE